jgi:Putative auto-transporter adhesin, head GIN domain
MRLQYPIALATLGLCAALLAGGCSSGGNSPPVSQQRGLDAFHSIDLRGAAELDVLVGPHQTVVLEAAPRVLEHIHTSVVKGELVIDRDAGGWLHTDDAHLKLRITLPKLNSLSLNGAGHISVAGLAGGATTIVLSGAGDVEANGTVETLTARINGAGNADLSHLEAENAAVTVNGAGNLVVKASKKLDARLNGVGSIRYVGQPAQLATEINGVGNIGPSGS